MEVDPDYAALNPVKDSDSDRNKDGLEAVNSNGGLPLKQQQRNASLQNINGIIEREFDREIKAIEVDILEIDKRLNDSRLVLDRLRASLLISYYDKSRSTNKEQSSTSKQQQPSIHPAIKTEIGKSIPPNRTGFASSSSTGTTATEADSIKENALQKSRTAASGIGASTVGLPVKERAVSEKTVHRVIVGNVSKYLPSDSRQHNDQSTHKWMVYVRGPREKPDISPFVSKVLFFLHPSYKPNDLVQVASPPFHVTRRGWGEFPIRVQLHLKDARSRKVDVIHLLKLDQTYTGLQSLGAETHVDVEIEHNVCGTIAVLPAERSSAAENISHQTIHHSPVKKTENECFNNPGNSNELRETSCSDNGLVGRTNTAAKGREITVKSEARNLSVESRLPDLYQDTSESIYINHQPPKKKIKVESRPSYPTHEQSIIRSMHSRPFRPGLISDKISIKRCQPATNSVSMVSLLNPNPHISKTRYHMPDNTPHKHAISTTSKQSTSITIKPLSDQKNTLTSSYSIQSAPSGSLSKSTTALSSQITSQTESGKQALKPIFMKYELKDGKIILVRKDMADKMKVNVAAVNSAKEGRSKHFLVKPKEKRKQVIIRRVTDASSGSMPVHSAKPPLSSEPSISSTTHSSQPRKSESPFLHLPHHRLPPFRQLDCLENLVSWLAAAHPLVISDSITSTGSSCLLPKMAVFLSWPAGKRRALEWRRARFIRKDLLRLSHRPDFSFTDNLSLWSTKNIAVWCRNHLYSPCCTDNVHRPLPFLTPDLPTKSNASHILSTCTNSENKQKTADEKDVDIVSVAAPVNADDKAGMSSSTIKAVMSVNPSREERFIIDLASQVGVRLAPTSVTETLTAPITSRVLSHLYLTFMQSIIRCAHSARASRLLGVSGECEISSCDIRDAVQSHSNLLFLSDVFAEYGEDDGSEEL